MVLTRTQSTVDNEQTVDSTAKEPATPASAPVLSRRRTPSNTHNNCFNSTERSIEKSSVEPVRMLRRGRSSGPAGTNGPVLLRPEFLPPRAQPMPTLLAAANDLLQHLNALWVLRTLGAPRTQRQIAKFCEQYAIPLRAGEDDAAAASAGREEGFIDFVTDSDNNFGRFATAVHIEAISFVRACAVDSRSASHRQAKRSIEKLVREHARQAEANKENGGVPAESDIPPIVIKNGSYNAVAIAESLDLCLRTSRTDIEHDNCEVVPAYEDAVRELIGYCELADLQNFIISEQIGGRHGCEEVAQATLLPLTLHLNVSEDDPNALPIFESSWRALHGDLSGIIVHENLPTEGLLAHDAHVHMRPLFLHAAALFKKFKGRQQCDLNPRNLLLDWNGSMKKSDLGMYGTPRYMDAGTFGTLHPLQQFTDLSPTDFYPEWSGLMLDVFSLTLVMLRLFDERTFGPLIDIYAEHQRNQRRACDVDVEAGDSEDAPEILSNDELLGSLATLRNAVLVQLEAMEERQRSIDGRTNEAKRLHEMSEFVEAVLSTDPSKLPSADDIIQGRGVAAFCACMSRCDHESPKLKIVAQAKKKAEARGDSTMVSRLEELQGILSSSITDAEDCLRDARRARNNATRADTRRDDILQELLQARERAFGAAECLASIASEEDFDLNCREFEKAQDELRRTRSRCDDLQEQLDLVLEEAEMWRYKQDKGIEATAKTLRRAREQADGDIS